ncbi:hypothetical protein ACUOFC_61670, partial [Escherichia sp. TWPC-MK]
LPDAARAPYPAYGSNVHAGCHPHPNPLPVGARGLSGAVFSSVAARGYVFLPRPFRERAGVRVTASVGKHCRMRRERLIRPTGR